jgi:hypothetical protein
MIDPRLHRGGARVPVRFAQRCCETHAPVFWESEPALRLAHTPLPKSRRATLTPSTSFILELHMAHANQLTIFLHSVATVTFSVLRHKLHSKLRPKRPPDPSTAPTKVIGPWHFGHGGRSISMRLDSGMVDCDIMLPALRIWREHKNPGHR